MSWIIRSSEKRGFPRRDEFASLHSCENPLRAGKEFQHEFTSVRNSGAGSKRFFGLRMKRHCGLDPQSHNCGNAPISEIRMERLRSQSHYNEITTQTSFARNDNKKLFRKGWSNNAPQDVTNLVPYCLSNLVTSRKVAFTLAEVLITLAIIGVVAALTIPTLV